MISFVKPGLWESTSRTRRVRCWEGSGMIAANSTADSTVVGLLGLVRELRD